MEATRLAPAGRACSKFVWQGRFQKKLGGSSACHSGRPAFCENHASPPLIKNHRSPRHSFVFDRFDLRYPSALGGAAIRTCVLEMRAGWRWDSPSPVLRRIGVVVCAARAGHVVAAFGRHSSRPKCGGRRDGCPVNRRPPGATAGSPRSAGGRRNSLANSKRSGINSAQRA